MTDITSHRLLYFKGFLMLLAGGLAAGLLIARSPDWESVVLLGIAIWGFCRAYYFAFYVVEHYADPGFRYAGLIDFLQYAWRKAREGQKGPQG